MVVIDMRLMPLNVIREKFVYELKMFLGYQRILDLKSAQTLERKMCQKK